MLAIEQLASMSTQRLTALLRKVRPIQSPRLVQALWQRRMGDLGAFALRLQAAVSGDAIHERCSALFFYFDIDIFRKP